MTAPSKPDSPTRTATPRELAEERSQGRTRVVICVGTGLIFTVIALIRDLDPMTAYRSFIPACAGYSILSLAWILWIRRTPRPHRLRRVLAILLDTSITTLGLSSAGAVGTAFYPVYLWISVGNGMRYGRGALLSATTAGALGFGYLVIANEHWQLHRSTGVGLWIALVILPLFYLSLLNRLHHTNAKLEDALDRAQNAAKAKGQFLANMSHELRTPMNGILGLSQLVLQTPLEPLQRRYLEMGVRSTETLLALINDILDFSRLGAGKIELERIDFCLGELVEDVSELLRLKAEEKYLELRVESLTKVREPVHGDPTRIRQVMMNLVGNALKFTEKGHVCIRYGVQPDSEGLRAILEVEDTGIGIPADRVESIFEEFEQADTSTSRRFGGTGLGLAISRDLAALMGGSIRVRSVEGKGSNFVLDIPIERARDLRPRAQRERDEDRNYGLKVLVVEDNRVNQVVAEGLLSTLGMEIHLAGHGGEALERLRSERYDLVFMDLHMPVMDGITATQAIRASGESFAGIPILALTADVGEEVDARALEAGMNGTLNKPFRKREIVRAVDALELSARPEPVV